MKKRFFCGLLTATICLPLLAQSGTQSGTVSPYSQYGMGLLADPSQVSNRALGGTGIGMRDGTQVNTLNPASYSAIDSLTMLFDAGLSGEFTNFKEGNTRVNSRSAGFDYATGLFRMRKNLGVAFGILPFSDVGYNYTTSNYLNNEIGSVVETYKGTGGLHQAFIGAGWRPFKPISLGVNFAYLWGTYTRSVASTATTTINSLSKTYKASINNYNLSAGLQLHFPLGRKDYVTLGATASLGHKLNADPECSIVNMNTSTLVSDTTTFTISNGLELPMSYGGGFSWQHNQRLTLAADLTLQKWGSIPYPSYNETTKTYALQKGLLRDRKRASIGIDYVPNPMHPKSYLMHVHYRVGAAYSTSYYFVNGHDGPRELTVSAGLGLPLLNKWENRSVLNISAQWVRTSAKDLITDNTIRINVGLTFNERWFAKWRVD